MNPRWLLHASSWARNPPAARRVWLVLGVVVACLLLAGLERGLGLGDGKFERVQTHFTRN